MKAEPTNSASSTSLNTSKGQTPQAVSEGQGQTHQAASEGQSSDQLASTAGEETDDGRTSKVHAAGSDGVHVSVFWA